MSLFIVCTYLTMYDKKFTKVKLICIHVKVYLFFFHVKLNLLNDYAE